MESGAHDLWLHLINPNMFPKTVFIQFHSCHSSIKSVITAHKWNEPLNYSQQRCLNKWQEIHTCPSQLKKKKIQSFPNVLPTTIVVYLYKFSVRLWTSLKLLNHLSDRSHISTICSLGLEECLHVTSLWFIDILHQIDGLFRYKVYLIVTVNPIIVRRLN